MAVAVAGVEVEDEDEDEAQFEAGLMCEVAMVSFLFARHLC